MGNSFLRAALRGEEPDSQNDPASVEDTYRRLFPKIGRDFVHRDDLVEILQALLLLLNISEDEIELYIDGNARARALEYRDALASGATETIHEDLIDLGDV